MNMKDENILNFIDDLASDKPTPGGGAASGMAGSLGAASILMALRFSNTKKLDESDQEKMNKAIEQLEESKSKFFDLIQEDEEAFKPLSNAYNLPSSTEEEKEYKQKEVQKGLVTASEPPIELMKEAKRVMDITSDVLPLIKKFIASDAGVGVQLVRSASMSSSLTVYINANLMKDEEQKERYMTSTDELVESSVEKANSVFEEVQSIIIGK